MVKLNSKIDNDFFIVGIRKEGKTIFPTFY